MCLAVYAQLPLRDSRAVYRESCDMDVTVGNKKMAGTCTSDHALLEYNSHKLLRNLLAAILFPKNLDLTLLSL